MVCAYNKEQEKEKKRNTGFFSSCYYQLQLHVVITSLKIVDYNNKNNTTEQQAQRMQHRGKKC